MSSHLEKLSIQLTNHSAIVLNLLEKKVNQPIVSTIDPYEIRTIGFEEET